MNNPELSKADSNNNQSASRRRILVLMAHPLLERSEINRPMAEAALGLEGATLKDLMEADRMQLHDRSERGWTPPPKHYADKLGDDIAD